MWELAASADCVAAPDFDSFSPCLAHSYGRYEVLAGFVNAIFLVFVAFSVVLEGLERLWTPAEVHGDHLLTVAVLGLLVNLIGIFFFHDAHGGHGHSHGGGGGHGHSHNDNMEGIFLHILADTLGSVGVIVSSVLISLYVRRSSRVPLNNAHTRRLYAPLTRAGSSSSPTHADAAPTQGWTMSDAIASLFISVLILLSVVPLVKNTASVLLSRTPLGMEGSLRSTFVSVRATACCVSPTIAGWGEGEGEGSPIVCPPRLLACLACCK